MKTTEKKSINTTVKHRSTRPFVDKSGKSAFISKSDINPTPFIQLQPEVAVDSNDSLLEQEAREKSEMVMRMPVMNHPEPIIQKKCRDCEKEEIQKQEESLTETPSEEDIIHPKAEGQPGKANPSVVSMLQSSKGQGRPIPESTRSSMETAFGSNFEDVRIHTGSDAVKMNKELHAQAFTYGNDVYFNEGKFSPETGEGKKLLAHELTHVTQQIGNQYIPKNLLQLSPFSNELVKKPSDTNKFKDRIIQSLADTGSHFIVGNHWVVSFDGIAAQGRTRQELCQAAIRFLLPSILEGDIHKATEYLLDNVPSSGNIPEEIPQGFSKKVQVRFTFSALEQTRVYVNGTFSETAKKQISTLHRGGFMAAVLDYIRTKFESIAKLITVSDLKSHGLTSLNLIGMLSNPKYRYMWAEIFLEQNDTNLLNRIYQEIYEEEKLTSEIDFRVLNRISDESWKEIILEGASNLRKVFQILEAQKAKEFEKMEAEKRSEALKPILLSIKDPAKFVLENFDPNSRIHTGTILGIIQGGDRLENSQGEKMFILRANNHFVIFQNESNNNFYSQYTTGFIEEIRFAFLAKAARSTRHVIVFTDLMAAFLGGLFPPVRYSIIAAHVLHITSVISFNWEDIKKAYNLITRSTEWIDKYYPGLTEILFSQTLSELRGILHWEMDFRDWVHVLARILSGSGAAAGGQYYVRFLLRPVLRRALVIIWGLINGALGYLTSSTTRISKDRIAKKISENLSEIGLQTPEVLSQLLVDNRNLNYMLISKLEELEEAFLIIEKIGRKLER